MLAAVALGRVAFGLQFQSVASAGPELTQRFGLDYAGLGTVVGLYMAAGVVLSLPCGILGRWLGERRVVGIGLGAMAAGAVITAVAPGLAGIGWGRALAGAGAVSLIVMQGKVVADRFSGGAFMPAMGLVVGAFPVGVGLAGALAPSVGWAGLAWTGAVPAVLACALMVLCAERAGPAGRFRMAWPNRRECTLVLVAGLVWTCYNGGYYAYLAYLPSWMVVRGHPAALSGAVMIAATWLNLPAMLGGGAWAARSGTGLVFTIGAVCAVAGLAGPAFADWPILWGLLLGTVGAMHAGLIVALGTLSTRPENQAVGHGACSTRPITMRAARCSRRCAARAADRARRPGRRPAGRRVAGSHVPAHLLGLHRRLVAASGHSHLQL